MDEADEADKEMTNKEVAYEVDNMDTETGADTKMVDNLENVDKEMV